MIHTHTHHTLGPDVRVYCIVSRQHSWFYGSGCVGCLTDQCCPCVHVCVCVCACVLQNAKHILRKLNRRFPFKPFQKQALNAILRVRTPESVCRPTQPGWHSRLVAAHTDLM